MKRWLFRLSSEDFPDLSPEKLIAKKEELMREIESQANAPARGRGRAREGKKGNVDEEEEGL